jgi:hypothetical protein
MSQNYFRETPKTEYLFIVGVAEKPKIQRWKALQFQSGGEVPNFADCSGTSPH